MEWSDQNKRPPVLGGRAANAADMTAHVGMIGLLVFPFVLGLVLEFSFGSIRY